jgi:hydrogenase expression/formation protein HypD
VVSGFKTEEIKGGIYNLLDQIEGRKPIAFSNQYERCVSTTGNKLAQQYINEVYKAEDGYWRGIGLVPNSALGLQGKYKMLDAKNKFNLSEKVLLKSSACQCSEIILGIKAPYECKQFGVNCTPETPLGPCMVSSEGACSAHYRYGREAFEE